MNRFAVDECVIEEFRDHSDQIQFDDELVLADFDIVALQMFAELDELGTTMWDLSHKWILVGVLSIEEEKHTNLFERMLLKITLPVIDFVHVYQIDDDGYFAEVVSSIASIN